MNLRMKILNLLSANNTIINIDEAWYNRSIKQNYSSLPTGRSERIINDRWQGRAVIIFALVSSGDWIALIGNKTTNSTLFIRFLFILKKFTEICLELVEDPIMVTLDNSSIHLTDNTKRAAEILKMKFFFLPPFSPSLAPVEWVFGMSKKILSTARSEGTINFGIKNGKLKIADSLKKIDPDIIGRRQWLKFINSMKIIIGEILRASKTQTAIEKGYVGGE